MPTRLPSSTSSRSYAFQSPSALASCDRQDRGKGGSPRFADHGLAAGLRSLQADNEETEVFAFQAEVRRRRRPAAASMRDASRSSGC